MTFETLRNLGLLAIGVVAGIYVGNKKKMFKDLEGEAKDEYCKVYVEKNLEKIQKEVHDDLYDEAVKELKCQVRDDLYMDIRKEVESLEGDTLRGKARMAITDREKKVMATEAVEKAKTELRTELKKELTEELRPEIEEALYPEIEKKCMKALLADYARKPYSYEVGSIGRLISDTTMSSYSKEQLIKQLINKL